MNLLILSLILGFFGFIIGVVLGLDFFAYGLGVIGILSPAFYVLEKMYKQNSYSNELVNDVNDDSLNNLKDNGILTDIEYGKAYLKFKQTKEKDENRAKYDEAVDILYKLAQDGIISDNDFNDKIRLLKTLYKQ